MPNLTDVLPLLQCPITRKRLIEAEPALLDRVNGMIHRHQLPNRLGEIVGSSLDEGLIDEAGEWLYAVRDGIVCLLADEAIAVDRLDIEETETDV